MIRALAPLLNRHGTLLIAAFLVLGALIFAPGLGFFSILMKGEVLADLRISQAQVYALKETLLLLGGVAVLAGSIGLVSAWLVSLYDIPLRRVLDIALLLPLAFPTYLAAFVAVDLLDFFGPVQSAWRWLIGAKSARDYRFFEIRSLGGAIFVLSLVLFPYIYVPCRLVFARTGRNVIDAARLLGASGFGLFWRVGVPLARPALLGGLVLALLETLNDLGATEHLGISSLSVVIRDLWLNRSDLPGAARLAAMLIALVVVLVALASHSKREMSGRQGRINAAARLMPTRAVQGWMMAAACGLPVLLGFVVPSLFLLSRAVLYSAHQAIDPDFLRAAATTFAIGIGASVIVVGCGAILASAMRLLPALSSVRHMTSLGYATPGTVLVFALLPVLRIMEDGLSAVGSQVLLSASALAIIYALSIRFFGIGANQASLALSRLPRNVDQVARLHGLRNWRLAFKVHLPSMMPGLALGGLLVFIDAVKELPATLLLRPLNLETLATRAYAQASAGTFERAALDSLAIVLLGAVAAMILARQK